MVNNHWRIPQRIQRQTASDLTTQQINQLELNYYSHLPKYRQINSIYFWKDYHGEKYYETYFERFPNVWTHGDFIEITKRGGVIVYGRSDTVLNPAGVRIGTSEIYRPVEEMIEIVDSIAVAQSWENDVRIVLFVVLIKGLILDSKLISKIKANIRSNATPRHIPSRILEIQDVPRTISGKKVEKAVLQTIKGECVENISALANPESLSIFADLREELKK